MTVDITSEVYSIEHQPYFSVHFAWGGTPTGVVRLEGSTDGRVFFDIPSAAQSTGGAPGTHTIDYAGAGFLYIRLRYIFASSTGTLSAYVSARGV
jgi:hypothetical protein